MGLFEREIVYRMLVTASNMEIRLCLWEIITWVDNGYIEFGTGVSGLKLHCYKITLGVWLDPFRFLQEGVFS